MNVVGSVIVVPDFDILPRHHAQHMRMILAPFLIDSGRILGNIKRPIAQPIFYVHEHVGEIARVGNNGFWRVCAFASRILTHVYLARLGSGAIKLYGAVDGRRRTLPIEPAALGVGGREVDEQV